MITIPKKVRQKAAENPFFKMCCHLQRPDFHKCNGNIVWEHPCESHSPSALGENSKRSALEEEALSEPRLCSFFRSFCARSSGRTYQE